MSRYIDADALIERILKLKVVTDNKYGMGITRGIERAETAIQMQPTADVVEVVRCKDCKYYTEHYQGTYGEYGRCDHPQQNYELECFDMWVVTNPDDYCSCGERRKE